MARNEIGYGWIGFGGVLGVVFVLLIGNFVAAGSWVRSAQEPTPESRSFSIYGHLEHFIDPGTLVLSLALVEDDELQPDTLWDTVAEIADHAYRNGREYDRVLLTRHHRTVFVISGSDFAQLGASSPEREFAILQSSLRYPAGQKSSVTQALSTSAWDWVRGSPSSD